MLINNSYHPLISALPLSLVDQMVAAQTENDDDLPRRSETNHSQTKLRPSHGSGDSVEMADRRSEKSQEQGDGQSYSSSRKGQAKELDFLYAEPMAERLKKEAEYGFAHPAASRPQRIVWLPLAQGSAGLLSKSEAKECHEAGVTVSLVDAEMNEKGKVDISGPPPDLVREE